MLVSVSPPWGPGEGYRVYVRAGSTVDLVQRLGSAIRRDADRWGQEPSRHTVTGIIQTVECYPEPGDVADVVLANPPEWVRHTPRPDDVDVQSSNSS